MELTHWVSDELKKENVGYWESKASLRLEGDGKFVCEDFPGGVPFLLIRVVRNDNGWWEPIVRALTIVPNYTPIVASAPAYRNLSRAKDRAIQLAKKFMATQYS